ncbi:MAG: prepilin-type N-terminal cleavage/methylation domain-containing protein [Bacilli bacterium]|nr:prepilin-type N-terminal cleavage/methylation domain-containing protein [Bacilli bacterium]
MKKGFTLIELLAVIVILAIIALIAIPTITGLVEKTKKGAAGESANGYIDAIDKQMALNLMDSDDTNDLNKGIYDAPFDNKYNIKVKGQTPSKGWVEVTKNGVDRYSLVIGEYVVSYDGNEKTVVKGTEPNEKPDFASQSWETIIANVRNGKTDDYHVGDTKEVDMGTFGKHTVRIANMSTPSECSTEGFSQTACGFVLEFSDIITIHSMNANDTNEGGWPATSMRTFVNSDIYNSLPGDLRLGIIDTKVVSGHGKNDNTNFISTDKLYLLSPKEIWNNDCKLYPNDSNSLWDSAANETRQLDYYKINGVAVSNNYSVAVKNTGSYWWLRTVMMYAPGARVAYSDIFFFRVERDGWPSLHRADYEYGVSPAFRIG